jgi:hypothetical protein
MFPNQITAKALKRPQPSKLIKLPLDFGYQGAPVRVLRLQRGRRYVGKVVHRYTTFDKSGHRAPHMSTGRGTTKEALAARANGERAVERVRMAPLGPA